MDLGPYLWRIQPFSRDSRGWYHSDALSDGVGSWCTARSMVLVIEVVPVAALAASTGGL